MKQGTFENKMFLCVLFFLSFLIFFEFTFIATWLLSISIQIFDEIDEDQQEEIPFEGIIEYPSFKASWWSLPILFYFLAEDVCDDELQDMWLDAIYDKFV